MGIAHGGQVLRNIATQGMIPAGIAAAGHVVWRREEEELEERHAVVSFTMGALQGSNGGANLWDSPIGTRFVVGAHPIVIRSVGRMYHSGDTSTSTQFGIGPGGTLPSTNNTNQWRLVTASHPSGTPAGSWVWADVSPPLDIAAGTDIGIRWARQVANRFASVSPIAVNSDFTVVRQTSAASVNGTVGMGWGPCDFRYTGGAPPPPEGIGFSLEEQPTGDTWVDGRPIYQKTVQVLQLGNNTEVATAHNIEGLDLLISLRGFASNTGGTGGFVVNSPRNSLGSGLMAFADRTHVRIVTGADRSAFNFNFVHLRYVKT